ncbi:uncharacterized protein MONOS_12407 [Monocercomonoides exilis]|uniref:uncharacterized protein n=1 Tax=Monocercomonoides exilis TaxID=2049356 RepID=UPI003559CCEC|nr:hypothetical protein MONOS_12407 [Monocercomonoides exilis]|eukprot:MONOS_12407.1-p1 / transcript=MONOS_12407.1 / gene=MONOS_12407 / organism=Monocercomonoides_exilis_PA203 / gene_product=unspecified product / transcript_product=unspecified product / location=Mono_scaffold00685:29899-34335(-) / protein_length=1479 / sequence_SO=supercontig / SO=protein_coding / is_pseudo=false
MMNFSRLSFMILAVLLGVHVSCMENEGAEDLVRLKVRVQRYLTGEVLNASLTFDFVNKENELLQSVSCDARTEKTGILEFSKEQIRQLKGEDDEASFTVKVTVSNDQKGRYEIVRLEKRNENDKLETNSNNNEFNYENDIVVAEVEKEGNNPYVKMAFVRTIPTLYAYDILSMNQEYIQYSGDDAELEIQIHDQYKGKVKRFALIQNNKEIVTSTNTVFALRKGKDKISRIFELHKPISLEVDDGYKKYTIPTLLKIVDNPQIMKNMTLNNGRDVMGGVAPKQDLWLFENIDAGINTPFWSVQMSINEGFLTVVAGLQMQVSKEGVLTEAKLLKQIVQGKKDATEMINRLKGLSNTKIDKVKDKDFSFNAYGRGSIVFNIDDKLEVIDGCAMMGIGAGFEFSMHWAAGPIPMYIVFGLAADGAMSQKPISNPKTNEDIYKDMSVMFSLKAYVEGGAGIRGFLSVGARLSAIYSFTGDDIRNMKVTQTVTIAGSIELSVLFIFTWEKTIKKHTWDLQKPKQETGMFLDMDNEEENEFAQYEYLEDAFVVRNGWIPEVPEVIMNFNSEEAYEGAIVESAIGENVVVKNIIPSCKPLLVPIQKGKMEVLFYTSIRTEGHDSDRPVIMTAIRNVRKLKLNEKDEKEEFYNFKTITDDPKNEPRAEYRFETVIFDGELYVVFEKAATSLKLDGAKATLREAIKRINIEIYRLNFPWIGKPSWKKIGTIKSPSDVYFSKFTVSMMSGRFIIGVVECEAGDYFQKKGALRIKMYEVKDKGEIKGPILTKEMDERQVVHELRVYGYMKHPNGLNEMVYAYTTTGINEEQRLNNRQLYLYKDRVTVSYIFFGDNFYFANVRKPDGHIGVFLFCSDTIFKDTNGKKDYISKVRGYAEIKLGQNLASAEWSAPQGDLSIGSDFSLVLDKDGVFHSFMSPGKDINKNETSTLIGFSMNKPGECVQLESGGKEVLNANGWYSEYGRLRMVYLTKRSKDPTDMNYDLCVQAIRYVPVAEITKVTENFETEASKRQVEGKEYSVFLDVKNVGLGKASSLRVRSVRRDNRSDVIELIHKIPDSLASASTISGVECKVRIPDEPNPRKRHEYEITVTPQYVEGGKVYDADCSMMKVFTSGINLCMVRVIKLWREKDEEILRVYCDAPNGVVRDQVKVVPYDAKTGKPSKVFREQIILIPGDKLAFVDYVVVYGSMFEKPDMEDIDIEQHNESVSPWLRNLYFVLEFRKGEESAPEPFSIPNPYKTRANIVVDAVRAESGAFGPDGEIKVEFEAVNNFPEDAEDVQVYVDLIRRESGEVAQTQCVLINLHRFERRIVTTKIFIVEGDVREYDVRVYGKGGKFDIYGKLKRAVRDAVVDVCEEVTGESVENAMPESLLTDTPIVKRTKEAASKMLKEASSMQKEQILLRLEEELKLKFSDFHSEELLSDSKESEKMMEDVDSLFDEVLRAKSLTISVALAELNSASTKDSLSFRDEL